MTTTTTTNYGWTIPNDSELVKDGAAAIRTLGNAADASLKTVSDAAIKATIVDAKGDLIAATAADTVARLAVGTDGQVLTADAASAAGVKWATASAGSMTLLSTTTLSGASTTISSINQSYKNLYLLITGVNLSANGNPQVLPNGSSGVCSGSGTDSILGNVQSFSYSNVYFPGYSQTPSRTDNSISLQIYNYASTTEFKTMSGVRVAFVNNANDWTCGNMGFSYNSNSAITSLTIATGSGSANFNAGTVKLYGVN